MFKRGVAGVLCVFALTLAAAALPGCPCTNKLEVKNSTIFPITAVYVRYQGTEDWGSNEISNTILPGETENIATLLPGCSDVRIVYLGLGDEEHSVCVLCEDSYTLEAGSD